MRLHSTAAWEAEDVEVRKSAAAVVAMVRRALFIFIFI